MEVEFPEIFNLRSGGSAQSLWVAIQEQEMKHPLTLVEEKMKTEEDSREKITEERMWSNRLVCISSSNRIPIKILTETKSSEFVILEFKRI